MTYVPPDTNPIKGAFYLLFNPCEERGLAGGNFLPPHRFTYVGISGVGDHQGQHEFVDAAGRYIAFCPALGKDGDWTKFLKKEKD